MDSADCETSGALRAPRVLIAHDYLTQRGGAERVVLAMMEAFPGARLVTSIYDPATTFPQFEQYDVDTLWPNRLAAFRRDPRRALPILASAMSSYEARDVDVVLASSSGWAHGLGGDVPKVVYCHNPARWIYQQDDYASGLPVPARYALRAVTPALRRWDLRAASAATSYLANSTAVRQRIWDAYGIKAGLLYPPPGLDPTGPTQALPRLESGFLLTVSRARGYKNTEVICDAVEGMANERLVVIGGDDSIAQRYSERIIPMTGVSDAQLRWLYANAAGVVGVSHEDFGLTPIEGYGFGLPSVLLRAGGYLDSSVEDVTTVYVDAPDAVLVRSGIQRLLTRSWNSQAIKGHAERFSKRSFAERLRSTVAFAARGRSPWREST